MPEQGELFGFHDMRPRAKVPISKERIQEAQRLLKAKDSLGCAQILREVRYKLEAYERRISNAEPAKTVKRADSTNGPKTNSEPRV